MRRGLSAESASCFRACFTRERAESPNGRQLLRRANRALRGRRFGESATISLETLPSRGAFANAPALEFPDGESMSTSPARTLKGSRRLQRSRDRRAPSPRWQFLRGFLKNPVMVGSIIPSSKVLIDKMLAPVDWANTKLFVEYGPGVGTFTRPILERLATDSKLVTIDTNPDFTKYLKERIDDPRLISVTGSAADVEKILADRDLGAADY